VVVIGVILLLAGLLFPALAQVRGTSRQTVCLSNLRQVELAYQIYVKDWDERLTDWWQLAPRRPEPFGLLRFWPEYLEPYLRAPGVLRDPDSVWSEPPTEIRLADYALYTWGPGGRGTQEKPYWRWAGPPLSLADVRRPWQTLHVMDGWTTTRWTEGRIARHRSGVNAVFLDGHAGWLPDGGSSPVDTDGRGFYWLRYAAADR
jgi:prepilin-type processing-associated H-X9-DG protein